MIGYKLFRKRKDGTYGSLFVDAKRRLVIGKTYRSKVKHPRDKAFRPGWHICHRPHAPHLSLRGRVWCKVEFELVDTLRKPPYQGDIWYIGSSITILSEVQEEQL